MSSSSSSPPSRSCCIIFYSITGTTKLISENIAEGMRKVGYSVEIVDVNDIKLELLNTFDIIGIGSPTHYYAPSKRILDFISKLPEMKTAPYFTFLLHGTYIGKAGVILQKKLGKKLGNYLGHENFKGADMYYGYLKEGVLASPNQPDKYELQRAVEFGTEIAQRFEKEIEVSPKKVKEPLIFAFQRFMTSKLFLKYIIAKTLKVKRKTCIKCGKCLEVCPENNISLNKKGYPSFDSNCIGCLTCQIHCPAEAIKSYADWKIIKLIIKGNVKRFTKDDAIDKEKILLSKGKVIKTYKKD
ncbi:MAG: EFR1 family ferrodoxin [Candidatus Heimdallarchaeaceae archaeon]